MDASVLQSFSAVLQSPYTILAIALGTIVFYEYFGKRSDASQHVPGKIKTSRIDRLSSSISDIFDVTGDLGDICLGVNYISPNVQLHFDTPWLEDSSIFENDGNVAGVTEEKARILLFPWVSSKQRHINKYVELYTKRGHDVLVAQMKIANLFWPARTESLAREVLEFIKDDKRPLIVHSFSAGSQVYGEMLLLMNREPEFLPVRDRIIGQIFDSCPHPKSGFEGFCSAVAENPLLWFAFRSVISTYYLVTHRFTMRRILQASQILDSQPIPVSALLLFSRDDPISAAGDNEKMMKTWQEDVGFEVQVKCWESSPHVAHLQKHREEYISKVSSFLDNLVPPPLLDLEEDATKRPKDLPGLK